MYWLLTFQWPAGVALILYGILTWGDGIEPLVGNRLSVWMQKTAPFSPLRFFLGILSGSALQGNRGLLYCKRRYLAGLLSPRPAILFALGMAIGLFVPATIIVFGPYYLAYAFLISGMSTQLACRSPRLRHCSRAVLGFGTCWIGYNACRAAPLPIGLLLYAILAVILLSCLIHTPAAVFLTTAACLENPGDANIILIGTCLAFGGYWLLVLSWSLRRIHPPFSPVTSLLTRLDLAFPERALQSTLQENRRMANGLARAANRLVTGNAAQSHYRVAYQMIRDAEMALDEFKLAAQNYLLDLTRHKLQERQARLVMFLFINISDLERISDHLLAVAETLPEISRRSEYPDAILQGVDAVLGKIGQITMMLAQSMTGSRERKRETAGAVNRIRDEALQMLETFTAALHDHILRKTIAPDKAIRMQELRSHFERLIRHVRAIAIAGEQDDFWIEPDAIHERAQPIRKQNQQKRLSAAQIAKLLEEHTP